MPHAVFNLGSQTATADLAARALIPGIEPGGSRAGRDTKPALLIRDAWLEVIDFDLTTADDTNMMSYFLKLSQELNLNPGLILPIGAIGSRRTGAGGETGGLHQILRERFDAQGTLWAPRVVGVRVVETGTVIQADVDVHIDYERIDVPWMDWFLMWEWLDGIGDNEREY